jgi:heat-inducible transcriptional repressor
MNEVGRIREELSQSQTVEERVERSSQMLTGLSNGLGIAAAIPTSSQVLDQVELILMGDTRVLMIVVTHDKMVHDHLMTLDEPIAQDELTSIRNYLNVNFSGWRLAEIRGELRARLDQASAAYDALLRKLILLYDKGLSKEPILRNSTWKVRRTSSLRLPAHPRTVARNVPHPRREKRILHLLERFLEPPLGEVVVQIGMADEDRTSARSPHRNLAADARRVTGKFAVIGPMRMDYDRALAAVRHVGQAYLSLPS